MEKKMISVADLKSSICAWDGCTESFKGEMPKGWNYLLTYWAPHPTLDILSVPQRDMPRDGVLCPAHTRALESQLKDLGRELEQAPMGNA
jgi:hypothetical protein